MLRRFPLLRLRAHQPPQLSRCRTGMRPVSLLLLILIVVAILCGIVFIVKRV